MIFKVQEIDVRVANRIIAQNVRVMHTVTLVNADACLGTCATLIIKVEDQSELKKYTDAYFNKTDIIVDIKI